MTAVGCAQCRFTRLERCARPALTPAAGRAAARIERSPASRTRTTCAACAPLPPRASPRATHATKWRHCAEQRRRRRSHGTHGRAVCRASAQAQRLVPGAARRRSASPRAGEQRFTPLLDPRNAPTWMCAVLPSSKRNVADWRRCRRRRGPRAAGRADGERERAPNRCDRQRDVVRRQRPPRAARACAARPASSRRRLEVERFTEHACRRASAAPAAIAGWWSSRCPTVSTSPRAPAVAHSSVGVARADSASGFSTNRCVARRAAPASRPRGGAPNRRRRRPP